MKRQEDSVLIKGGDSHIHYAKAEFYMRKAHYYKNSDISKYTLYYQKYLKHLLSAHEHNRTNMIPPLQILPGKVRLVHAAYDLENADVYLNGTCISKDLSYTKASSYLLLPAGIYQLDVYPSGNTKEKKISKKIDIEPGKSYTITKTGFKNSIAATIFEEHQIVPNGEAKFRFIHLSADAPAIDLAVKKGDVVFHDVDYREASEYLGLSPMTVHLEARVAGSSNHVLIMDNIEFKADQIYTIFLIGSITGSPELKILII